jgi:hypothetical protein
LKSDEIYPGAPRRLVSAWKKAGCSDRRLADLLGVNQFYVSQLLRRGIEPGNPDVREKLFLPRKPVQHREPKLEEWPGQKHVIKQIRAMHSKTTHSFKRWRKS